MKLQTVRVRRSRPSALALALALMLTMLFVYLVSLSSAPEEADDAFSARIPDRSEVRMEGMEVAFVCEAHYENQLEARVAAARCAQAGGAGMILSDGDSYAVIHEAVNPEGAPEDALILREQGLTLRLNGASGALAAIAQAVEFLRAQAAETGSLADALERGDTDAASLCALMDIYRTQGRQAQSALCEIQQENSVVEQLRAAIDAALPRLEDAAQAPDAARLRLVHAAACGEWIRLLQNLREQA